MIGYDVHNKTLREYCSEIMDFDKGADIAFTIQMANIYQPTPHKFNILFTMWEYLDIPRSYINGINKADAIVVPSRFCKNLFQQYTDRPVEVCWEGVRPSIYKFHERTFPDLGKKKFRFLWVGAPDIRKGWHFLTELVELAEQKPEIELYIKTTAAARSKTNLIQTTVKKILMTPHDIMKSSSSLSTTHLLGILKEKDPFSLKKDALWKLKSNINIFGRHQNIIVDLRRLPLNKLVHIYNQAHCFIYPTRGEGFGLTLCEALATGCPSIATPVTGVADFFDEDIGYPVKHDIREVPLKIYNLNTREFVPDTKDFIQKMIFVLEHYKEALKKGKKASKKIRNKFTWKKSALRLEELIRRFITCDNSSKTGFFK